MERWGDGDRGLVDGVGYGGISDHCIIDIRGGWLKRWWCGSCFGKKFGTSRGGVS